MPLTSSSDPPRADLTLNEDMIAMANRLATSLRIPDSISDEALARLFAATVQTYAARAGSGTAGRPFGAGGHGVTATDVMIATTAMLHAVNVQVFELGMWQAWTGSQAQYPNESPPVE